jgi:hypothetical protein
VLAFVWGARVVSIPFCRGQTLICSIMGGKEGVFNIIADKDNSCKHT